MVFEQMKEAALGWWGHLTDIALEYPLKELAAATGNFGPKHRLGEGAAGAVFRGTLRGGTEVAVKVLNDMGGLEGFEDEVRVLSRFRHPNVVTLLGWAQNEGKKYLVYELLPCGDLQGKLRNSKEGKAQFSWQQRLHVAVGTASGLSHMMNSKPMAFHRDIKPANILLDTDGSAKIADFGLAGVVHQEGVRHMTVQNISGTPGYVCPTYALSARVTEASEVYAFGTVLLELLLNQPPALQGPEGDLMFPLLQVVQPAAPGAHARLMAALDPTAAWPAALAEELADLALTCVDLVPERRPNFETCVRVLRQLRARAMPRVCVTSDVQRRDRRPGRRVGCQRARARALALCLPRTGAWPCGRARSRGGGSSLHHPQTIAALASAALGCRIHGRALNIWARTLQCQC